jgi:hypothetical protein
MSLPEILEDVDYGDLLVALATACHAYLKKVADGGDSSDEENAICEAALKGLYGSDVFDWINERKG